MTINGHGVLIDEYSSEYQNRMKYTILFPYPVMHDTLVIEDIHGIMDDNDQAFRQVKALFYVLDRIQNALIALQNMCFLNLQNSIWI
jgi:hypothetical protein